MNSQQRLLFLISKSNPQTTFLTPENLIWSVPIATPNSSNGCNTQITLSAREGSGYSGSITVSYSRMDLGSTFGSGLTTILDRNAGPQDLLDAIFQAHGARLRLDQLQTFSLAQCVIGQFVPVTLLAKGDSLELTGSVTIGVWLKLPGQNSPDISLAATRAHESRLTSLEQQTLVIKNLAEGGLSPDQATLEKLNALAPGMVRRFNAEVHPLHLGEPVYALDNLDNVKLANASDVNKKTVMGLVAESVIAATADGKIQTTGVLKGTATQWKHVTGDVGGLVPKQPYFLDIQTGKLTLAPSTQSGHFLTPIGSALSLTELSINIERPITL